MAAPVMGAVREQGCEVRTSTCRSEWSSGFECIMMVVPSSAALCDNGATVNCAKSKMGIIPGTPVQLDGPGLVIGDENAIQS